MHYTITYTYGSRTTTTRRERCGWGHCNRVYVPGQVRRHETAAEARQYVEADPTACSEVVTLARLRHLGWSRSMIENSIRLNRVA